MKNWFLLVCLAAYAMLTALIVFTVPINAAPDEGAHLEYAQYLIEKKKLPIFAAKGANFPGYEFHQPPLYYAATALVWKFVPEPVRPYAARLVSLFCGIGALIFLWHSVRMLFPENETIAQIATGFGALWPLHISVGASAGNDALAGFMCAGIFWTIARIYLRLQNGGIRKSDAVLVGLFFGLGMLSKSSCLTVGLAGLGATFFLTRKSIGSKAAMRSTLLALAVTCLICGAWLFRNQTLYGDPLAAKIFDEAFKNSSPRPQAVMAATGVNFLEYLRAYFIVLFATCWGFFGGPNTAITVLNPFGSRVAPQAFDALPFMLFCLAATVVAKLGFIKWLQNEWQKLDYGLRISLVWWGVGMALVLLALLRFNFIQFQAQARYLHPALLPMCLLLALGWLRILGSSLALRMCSFAFGAVLIFISLWNALGWKTLV